MNDNELIAWEVVDDEYMTLHICLKRETAKYLRDWCDAECINLGIDRFHHIYETEVIVG